ncbi:TatD family hydrolase [Treponema zioleckii]|uniref:TatD family hydrolase n=1 Tax=Treponema zioleckii TaxID=331680 RepID=UPI00168A5B76|nr:TatD family hydrolase [Treponema zioleckii]
MTFCDAHIHLSHCDFTTFFNSEFFNQNEYKCCTTFCLSKEIEEFYKAFCSIESKFFDPGEIEGHIKKSFGIHPQIFAEGIPESELKSELDFLENLLKKNQIDAIGEIGFDLFSQEFKATLPLQEKYWQIQAELAKKYEKPIIVHIRKAVEKIFKDSKLLSSLPAVVFHSFPGTLREAESILNHGINAYFSFGKPILNGKKSAIDCVKNLSVERLLFETDAPYQTLKNEAQTFPHEILRVYECAANIREVSLESLCEKVRLNFEGLF